jgi:hypothetical protein
VQQELDFTLKKGELTKPRDTRQNIFSSRELTG